MAIQIDMTPDGQFTAPGAMPGSAPMSSKILRLAIIVAVIAAIGAVAFVALWLAMALIPIAIGAGLVAYGVLRFKMWRAGMSGGQGIRRF